MAQIVATKQFVVIPCLEYSYTVGLTTLVEALALGIPVICSKNPYYEMGIDKEQIGITVAYGDVQGWKNAINFLMENPVIAKKWEKMQEGWQRNLLIWKYLVKR